MGQLGLGASQTTSKDLPIALQYLPIALLIKQQVQFSQLETTNLFDRDVNLIKSRQVEDNAFKKILLD